jgi:hypothetical protein
MKEQRVKIAAHLASILLCVVSTVAFYRDHGDGLRGLSIIVIAADPSLTPPMWSSYALLCSLAMLVGSPLSWDRITVPHRGAISNHFSESPRLGARVALGTDDRRDVSSDRRWCRPF